ncbi:MAG: alpha/beta hydrolase, partial [Pseudomonadota bacterium]
DLPGFGENAHMAACNRIEDFATWVIQTLKERGIEHYHLLGHSMGGMIAQDVSRMAGPAVERLILYGTGSQGALPDRFETIAVSKRRAVSDGASATARRISATWLRDRDNSPHFQTVSQIAQKARLPAIEAGLTAMERWSGTDRLAQIENQTLIIWGDLDRSYGWPQIALLWKEIPKASLCVLPSCAHLVHLEAPIALCDVVQRFLDEDRSADWAEDDRHVAGHTRLAL